MRHKNEGRALFCEDELAISRYVIYTPSQFARNSLLYLQETGTLSAVQPYETGRSGLRSYLFFIVCSGSGTFRYDGIQYHIQTGDCVFIDCRKPYSQISSEDLWTLQWVHMNGITMDQIYQKYREHGGKSVFSTKHGAQYQELLNQVYGASDGNTYLYSMELAEKLVGILNLLMRETLEGREEHHRPNSKVDVEAVKAYLEEHYQEQLTLEQLANHFFVDKFYLTKVFKQRYDTTINNYLNQVRITRAKELLRFTDRSIESVGRSVGIPEANYFARVFKKIEGISPSTYRQEW